MSSKTRYQELLAQLASIQAEIEGERSVLVRDAIATCTGLIADYGLTAFDLGLVKTHHAKPMKVKKSDKTFPVGEQRPPKPPKYVNPDDGRTWSGNGRCPSWMVGNRDDFLIGVKENRATQNNGHAQH